MNENGPERAEVPSGIGRRPPPPSTPPPDGPSQRGRGAGRGLGVRPPPPRGAPSTVAVNPRVPQAPPPRPTARPGAPPRRLPPSRTTSEGAANEEPSEETPSVPTPLIPQVLRTGSEKALVPPRALPRAANSMVVDGNQVALEGSSTSDAIPPPVATRGRGVGRGRPIPNPRNIPPPQTPPPPTTTPEVSVAPVPRSMEVSVAPPPVRPRPPASDPSPVIATSGEAPLVALESPKGSVTTFEKAKPRVSGVQQNKISPQRSASIEGDTKPQQPPIRSQLSQERMAVPQSSSASPISGPVVSNPVVTTTAAPPVRRRAALMTLPAPMAPSENATATVKESLIALEQGFTQFILWGLDAYGSDPSLQSDEERAAVFGNLHQIAAVHTASMSGGPAHEVLFSLIKSLSLYLFYVAHLGGALATTARLKQSGDLSTQSGVPIEAILERPKQHLEAYPLVIASWAERADSPEECDRLNEAALAFESIVRQVRKRDALPKHLIRLWDIEQSFQIVPSSLGETRELFLEGSARLKVDSKNLLSPATFMKVFMLKGLVIVASLAAAASGGHLCSQVWINPEELIVTDLPGSYLQFEAQGRQLSLELPSRNDKARWMSYLPVQYPGGRRPLTLSVQL